MILMSVLANVNNGYEPQGSTFCCYELTLVQMCMNAYVIKLFYVCMYPCICMYMCIVYLCAYTYLCIYFAYVYLYLCTYMYSSAFAIVCVYL